MNFDDHVAYWLTNCPFHDRLFVNVMIHVTVIYGLFAWMLQ